MLPTKGYFQDIECPYFNNSCGRPYCHFRHRKKQPDSDDTCNEESTSKEVPTYKPTPKSELAVSRSHIPISYVPDIIYRAEKPLRTSTIPKTTFSNKPTYKPTPISLLTSAVKNSIEGEDNVTINELKQSMASTKYSPEAENVSEFDYKPTSLEDKIISENLKKHEYKPIGENSDNISYNPTALEDIKEPTSSDIAYKPTSDSVDNEALNYKPSPYLENQNIDFENLDREFDMIDEIINMSDKTPSEKILKQNDKSSKDVNIIKVKIQEDSAEGLKASKSHKHSRDREVKSTKHDDSSKKSSKSKYTEKSHKDFKKDEHKHSSSNNSRREDNKHNEKESKQKERTPYKDTYEEKSKESIIKKHRSRSKDKQKDRDGPPLTSKDHEENKKERAKKSRNKEPDQKKKVTEKDKSKHSKYKEKDKYDHNKSKERNHKQANRHEDGKHSKNSQRNKIELVENLKELNADKCKEKMKYMLDEFKCEEQSMYKTENVAADIDIDFDDDDETMRECYKIFNEYIPSTKPDSSDFPEQSVQPMNEEEQMPSKKRIAHSNAPSTSAKFHQTKPTSLPTPGQVLNNRFKAIRALHANDEEKLIANEVKRVSKRPAPPPSLLEAVKRHKFHKTIAPVKSTTSLVDDILNGNKSKPVVKKIAPVANVMNIQKAKAQLEELNKKRATEQAIKTIPQTNKIGKRQAHIPEYSLCDLPDVIDVDKSKLPVNVRTRFLTMLADECCKLYLSQADAYKRALDEEYSCYKKCKVLVTYRNSAMLAVNRIRKELQEREQKNLGLLGSGETIFKNKESADRHAMYERIQHYVLTEEELDIHGYPRESKIPGRAHIKNRKTMPIIPLPKNQRKCCRCSKIYLVDDKGWVIYEEECIYHPLKKRTLRGEQMYLCCKSSDDSGCATSHTHVSEMLEDSECEGFQTTMSPDSEDDPRSDAIYALDCEMCYTTKGLELTRVTIVDTNCKTVYDSLVKPLNEIIDYNTRFSGITKEQMDRINTGILQVQANILHLCNSKTILIGHSLESDLKVLKIVHSMIIDTSVLFPHKMGLPHKRALRALASDYLKKIIQNDVCGHDSAEDAITCMELVKWKVKEDTKFKSVNKLC